MPEHTESQPQSCERGRHSVRYILSGSDFWPILFNVFSDEPFLLPSDLCLPPLCIFLSLFIVSEMKEPKWRLFLFPLRLFTRREKGRVGGSFFVGVCSCSYG